MPYNPASIINICGYKKLCGIVPVNAGKQPDNEFVIGKQQAGTF